MVVSRDEGLYGTGILFIEKNRDATQTRGGTLVCMVPGILFEEPRPTGSRPRDLIGLCKQQRKPHPPNTQYGMAFYLKTPINFRATRTSRKNKETKKQNREKEVTPGGRSD